MSAIKKEFELVQELESEIKSYLLYKFNLKKYKSLKSLNIDAFRNLYNGVNDSVSKEFDKFKGISNDEEI